MTKINGTRITKFRDTKNKIYPLTGLIFKKNIFSVSFIKIKNYGHVHYMNYQLRYFNPILSYITFHFAVVLILFYF